MAVHSRQKVPNCGKEYVVMVICFHSLLEFEFFESVFDHLDPTQFV